MSAPTILTAERIDAMLSIMAEVCLESVVEAGQRQKAAPDDEAFERCGRALQGACRNLRQTIAMKQRFDREEAAKARETQAAADTSRKDAERQHRNRVEIQRAMVRGYFEHLLWNEYEPDDAREIFDDLDERLHDLTQDPGFVDTPTQHLIARLADDIGLNDEPEPEPTPEPVEAAEPETETVPPQKPSPPCGERVGSGGGSSELAGSHPHPQPLPARGRGDPDAEPKPEPGPPTADAAPPPRPPDPPPAPYIPPWEQLRPGQRMPGGSGW